MRHHARQLPPLRLPLVIVAAALAGGVAVLSAQERVDEQMIARIKMEAFQHSKVLETVGYLTDVHAIRLANSPQYRAAAEWCRQKLAEWGFETARLEPWGNTVRGWTLERFSVEMTEPYYLHVIAHPKAWTRSTPGVLSGHPVRVEIANPGDLTKYKGTLRGAIVMNGKPSPAGPKFTPDARRLTDEEIRSQAQVMNPGSPRTYWEDEEGWIKSQAEAVEIRKFLETEGVAAVLEPSRADGLVLSVTSGGWWRPGEPQAFPMFVLGKEHYGRIWRLLERNIPVTLDLSLRTRFDDSGSPGVRRSGPSSEALPLAHVGQVHPGVQLGHEHRAGAGLADLGVGADDAAGGLDDLARDDQARPHGDRPTELHLAPRGHAAKPGVADGPGDGFVHQREQQPAVDEPRPSCMLWPGEVLGAAARLAVTRKRDMEAGRVVGPAHVALRKAEFGSVVEHVSHSLIFIPHSGVA
jgi:hypothetical protein